MAYFPFMIDITDKNCLVVGGGTIAFHKVKILSGYDVKIYVVSPQVCGELCQLASNHRKIEIYERSFQDDDIAERDFVIAATDDQNLNHYISDLCRQNNILVNAVDMKEACSFIFPALIKKDDLIISISTGGKSPVAAANIKNKIEKSIPDFYGRMIESLGRHREYVLEYACQEKRKEVFKQLFQYGIEHNGEIPVEFVEQVIKHLNGEEYE